jgi:Flp pilus assembly protein TadD
MNRSPLFARARVLTLLAVTVPAAFPAVAIADDPAADSLPALIKHATPGIVTIVAYQPERAMPSVGTGFLVAPDEVVTARHVFARVDRAVVRTSGGKTVAVTGILAEERASDLVLIKLKAAVEGATPLRVAAAAPEVGERLFTVSSPLGLEFSASDGIVSAYREVPGAGVSMQHTVAVSAGSSGCPLINPRGEVVAVQTGVITTGQKIVHAGQALNFAVSGKLIAALKRRKLRTLAECYADLPADWKPQITAGIDAISLHPLTREDFTAALAFFKDAVKDAPEDPDAWFRLGLCYEKAGEKDEAITQYLKAVELKPDFVTALNNMGAVYIGQGRYDRAAEVLRKAVKADPNHSASHGNLAVACVQQKDWPGALDAARNAVRLNANDAEARLNLGTAALRTGDRAEARRQREALIKMDRPRAERLKALLDADPGPD